MIKKFSIAVFLLVFSAQSANTRSHKKKKPQVVLTNGTHNSGRVFSKKKYRDISDKRTPEQIHFILTKVEKMLKKNSHITISRLSALIEIPRSSLCTIFRKLKINDREKFEELQRMSVHNLLGVSKSEDGPLCEENKNKKKFLVRTSDEKKVIFEQMEKILIENKQLNISQIAKKVGLPRSTLFDLIKNLRITDADRFDEIDRRSKYGLLNRRKNKKAFLEAKKNNEKKWFKDLPETKLSPLNTNYFQSLDEKPQQNQDFFEYFH